MSELTFVEEGNTNNRGINLTNPEEILDETLKTSVDDINEDLIITQEYVDNTLEEIKEMNFIEVQKFIREVKYQQSNLETAKETADNFLKLKDQMDNAVASIEEVEDNDYASKIIKADMEAETGIEDVNTFLENYEDTKEKMQVILDAALEKMHEYDDVKKTTSFLNNEMICLLEKNHNRIEESNPMFKKLNIYYSEVRKVFENRTSIDWIMEKLPSTEIEVRRLKRDLKKDKTGSVLFNVQKRVSSSLYMLFNTPQVSEFEEYLKELYKDIGGADLAFYVQYALFLVYNKEKTTKSYGKHKWVEVLIMNVLDVSTGTFDLDGGKDLIDDNLIKIGCAVKALASI